MNGVILDDNMSNLTSASNEASISSSHRNEIGNQPPPKKRRNLPGNPDPDAEVVAFSPRTLMATNRFICEICKKGFQRDQNLQLHRRGHNLPWKLKQRTNKEVKKKVYVCPEPTCVHHEAARALGDLTGIKKHFSRKHGEKKWNCEKCSKRYAVQSDWKAHSRICGTREYRCDCGTLFSRRDSFITHRAFCDALAEESARATITPSPLLSQPGPSSTSHFNLQSQLLHNPANLLAFPLIQREQNHQQSLNPKPDLSPWLASQASPDPPWLHHSFIHHENPNPSPSPSPSFPSFQPTVSPHMSATALLQKAAQMGSGFSSSPLAPSAAGSGLFSREELNLASFGNKAVVTSGCMELVGATDQVGFGAPSLLHTMVSSLPPGSGFEGSISFEEALNGMLNPKMESNFQETITKPTVEANFIMSNEGDGGSRGNDGLTRDFLGLRAFSHRGFQNMYGLDQINPSPSYDRQNQN